MLRASLAPCVLAILALSCWSARAEVLYGQDFDAAGQAALAQYGEGNSGAAAPPGWVIVANNANVTANLVVSGGSQPTAPATTGYYGTGNALDYSLDLYKSNNTPTFYILFTHTAPGACGCGVTDADDFISPAAECLVSDAAVPVLRDQQTPWPGEAYF